MFKFVCFCIGHSWHVVGHLPFVSVADIHHVNVQENQQTVGCVAMCTRCCAVYNDIFDPIDCIFKKDKPTVNLRGCHGG